MPNRNKFSKTNIVWMLYTFFLRNLEKISDFPDISCKIPNIIPFTIRIRRKTGISVIEK